VRMVIAPAVVTLLGDRAWWLPAWLDRLLPNISLEGPRESGDVAPALEELEPEPVTSRSSAWPARLRLTSLDDQDALRAESDAGLLVRACAPVV
jgi:hypothetical protein